MLRTTSNTNLAAIFLLVLFHINSYAQTIIENITINWEQQTRQTALTEDHTLHYLYFENASYDESQPQIPIFSKQFKLNSYGEMTARLVKEQYSPLTSHSNIDLSKISSVIDVKTAVAFERRLPIGVVHFVPIRKNPSTGQYEKLVSAEIQISLQPKPNLSSSARGFATTSNLSDGQIFKIGISSTGIYKLDYNFLSSLGVDIANIDPRKIQILGNGGKMLPESMLVTIDDDVVENAIYVAGESDGQFNQNDYVLFYAVGTKSWEFNSQATCGKFKHTTNPYTDENYYFVKIGTANGKRVNTRASVPVTSYNTDSYDALAHYELDELNLMEQEFALPPSGREWYGESFRITRTRDFSFSFNNRIETEPVVIHSDLAVRAMTSGLATMKMNGGAVGTPISVPTTTIYIYSDYAKRLTFPCNSITTTGQNINVQINLNHSSAAADMWLNYITLQARSELRFTGGQMPFRDSRTLGQGNVTYQLSNANNLTIWDISDPKNIEIQAYTSGTNSLSFGADATILREFIAFDNNQFYVPTNRGTVINQNLHAITTPPDAIFVCHASLKSEAERLAAHRRTHDNMTVDVIDVDLIYNEFASGSPDITAIRDFCKMLYERETATNKFTHLLLFGIGSFDYKSIGGDRTTANNPNLIPVYETPESMHPINTYTSDDYFSLLDPVENMITFSLLDIAVGRLPAANLLEATTFVDKIIAYDTDPDFLKDWKNRICFVADDEDTNLHLHGAEGAESIAIQQDSTYMVEKVYLDAFKQISTSGGERYPDAKNALLDILFKGTFIINYLGHGGDDGWTQERVFTSTDINALSNNKKLPLFITATCSFGPHDNPNGVSAGELLLLNPNGGAISVFTTVRVVIANSNTALVNSTFNVIFDKKANGEKMTTGEVLQKAKNNTTANVTNSRKYALLGDPTMKLAYPTHRIRTNQINGLAVTGHDTIRALQRITITGDIVDLNGNIVSGFNGTVYPTVYDKEDRLYTLGNDAGSYPEAFLLRKKIIFKGQATVTNGQFTFSFVVPKDINYTMGYGKISYYAENGTNTDASGYYNGLVVGGSLANAPMDNQGPEVLVYMNTEDFARGGMTDKNPTLLVKLYDENGINTVGNSVGHDLTGSLFPSEQTQHEQTEEYILNDFYESTINDYTRGTVLYPLKDLEPGLYNIKVKAWDTYNNPGEGDTDFIVAESANMALAHVLNYPNPFTTSTNFQFEHNYPYQSLEVQVQIYTVSGKLIKTINHDINAEANHGYRVTDIHWDGLDDYGDNIGKGVYIYKIFVQAEGTMDKTKQSSEFQKLVILK